MLAFLPLTLDTLAALRAGALRDVTAHAATPALFDTLGYTPDLDEDAEFAALTYASVAALTLAPRRLVAVAETAVNGEDPEGFGTVTAPAVSWAQVQSLFIGEPDHAAAEETAHRAVAGRKLASAWDDPAVQRLLAESDLLWYGAEEADAVAELLRG